MPRGARGNSSPLQVCAVVALNQAAPQGHPKVTAENAGWASQDRGNIWNQELLGRKWRTWWKRPPKPGGKAEACGQPSSTARAPGTGKAESESRLQQTRLKVREGNPAQQPLAWWLPAWVSNSCTCLLEKEERWEPRKSICCFKASPRHALRITVLIEKNDGA